MALVIMPANPIFVRRAWTPPAQNQVNKSGWTGARKVVRLPGAGTWKVSAGLKPISREAEAWPWKAFFTALEGDANSFLMPFACQRSVAANPTVGVGAVMGAETAPVVGMPLSATFLRAGQALTFLHPSGRRQLVLLTQNLVAGPAGTGTAHFRGALREAPAAGSLVEARNPVCEMAMASSANPWDEDEGVYKFAWDAEEAYGPTG